MHKGVGSWPIRTYAVIFVHDNGTYGGTRVSKDVIFDESRLFDKYIDNSPRGEELILLLSTCPS